MARAIAGSSPFFEPIETFRGALAGNDEWPVALVDVGRHELGGLRIGARDDECRHAHHVGGEPRRDEIANVRGGRDQHLAAHVTALLLRGELVLEVHAGGARLDVAPS